GQRVAAAVGGGAVHGGGRGGGKVFDVDGLAQAAGAARQGEEAGAGGKAGDAGEVGVAAGAVDERGTQQGGGGAAFGGGAEPAFVGLAQDAGQRAFARVLGVVLDVPAGGSECQHAAAADPAIGIPV